MNIEEMKKKHTQQKPMTDEMAKKYLENIIETGEMHGMTSLSITALRHISNRLKKLERIEKEYDCEIGDLKK